MHVSGGAFALGTDPSTMGPAGFLTLGLLLIGCLAVDTRLPPRKIGPVVDFSHFKDTAFSVFVLGLFLIMVCTLAKRLTRRLTSFHLVGTL